MENSVFKSLFIIFFIVFCMAQANSAAQTCQEALFLTQEVVSGSPPKRPLPIKDRLGEGRKQFRRAYNKGEFIGDERYISLSSSFGRGSYLNYFNARITGLENGTLIIDYIDQTGSIRSFQQYYDTGNRLNRLLNRLNRSHPLNFYEVSEKSKDVFHRFEQSPPLAEINFDSKNTEKPKEDRIDRVISISNQLRSSPKVNPYRTHIVDFEDQIIDHVEHIRQGILSSGTNVNSRLTILDAFKHEAESKRDNKELTYQYWLLWNMRLSILASPEQPTSWNWHTHEGTLNQESNNLNTLPHLFPSVIILPVIGPLKYEDFNKTIPHRVFLIELQNKDAIQDNMKMSPNQIYNHDVIHALFSVPHRIDLMDDLQFIKRYLQIAETFPDKIREMAKIGFFIFFHETTGLLKHGSNIKEFFEENIIITKQKDIYTRLNNKENDLGIILPNDIQSDREIEEYFEQVIDVFNTIYWQIATEAEQHL